MTSVVIALLIILIALVAGFIMFRKRVDTNPKDDSDVVTKMVHDIRTPMSVIKTNCEIAMMNPGLDPEIKKKMQDIIGELDKISAILIKANQDVQK